jgi:hypothetical protein
MFVTSYYFKAEIAKPVLLDFIAKTPPELFYFLVPAGNYVFGLFLTDELVEYFTNEFPVRSFEIVQPHVLKSLVATQDCKIWGNQELLSF